MKKEMGIEEAKELLIGINKLVLIFVRELKDGFQVEDLITIFSKLAMDKELRDAISGLDKLGGEFKDIDLAEGIELGQIALSMVPEVINELKKND
tara:strand:- start:340 stop:624 length:285 start_codon:yes stop_codon:yes gene_type:complete